MTKDNVVPAMTNKKFTGVVEDAVKAILAANGGGAHCGLRWFLMPSTLIILSFRTLSGGGMYRTCQ